MAKESPKKILRVGIIQGGRIVEERLIRKREDVSLGTAAKNTFILPTSALGKSFRLFETRGDAYCLTWDDRMDGRVSVHDQVVDLKALAKSGEVKRKGGRYTAELDERSRGKVVVGEFTLLFQFVDTPPVLPRPQLPAAARGGLAQRVDWMMFNIMLASFLIQAGLGIGLDIWWRQSGRYLQEEFGQRKTKAYELLKAEVLKEKADKEKEEPPEEEVKDDEETDEETDVPETAPEPVKKPDKKPAKKVVKEPESTAGKRAPTRSKAELRAAVEKKTFLHTLGAVGGGEGIGNTLAAGLSNAKLDTAYEGTGVASADGGSTKTFVGEPSAVKSGKSGYKGLGAGEGGGKRIKTKAVKSSGKAGKTGEIKVRLKIRGGRVSGQSGTGQIDKAAVKKVFSRRKKAIKYCYEKALKSNDSLSGKVKIRFTIGASGRVTNVKITKNTTGNSGIGNCIKSKVKSWKFPAPQGGSVTFSYPFILSKG